VKILILTPALPYPAHQGGALRNQGIIRGLAAAGHEIVLLSFSDESVGDWTPLYSWCRRVEVIPVPPRSLRDRLRDLLVTGQPDLAQRLISNDFRTRLIELLNSERFDIVQIEGLELGIYLRVIRESQPTARIVYDAHNAEYMLQQGIAAVERASLVKLPGAIYSQIQAGRIRQFEREVCQQADAVIAVSEDDARSLSLFRPDRTVFVVPNGIFVEAYAVEAPPKLGDHVLVFTGKMDYRPNVDAMRWFVGAILPRIRERVPDARLYIVGQKPHTSLHQLRSVDGVEITGWVAQVQPFLSAAHVYIAPLRMGSGTRLKILEAMASGKPVVATSAAAAGLNAETRAALIIADDPDSFAERTAALLQDPSEQQRLGALARQQVRAHYDWSALIPCLSQVHAQLIGSPRG
jgi:glycosyltransferase involved in cell wall biosynthesis